MATAKVRPDVLSPRSGLTRHAHQRLAQRGIQQLQVDLIHLFGVDHLQQGGTMYSFIPERTIAELKEALERCARVALIKGDGEHLITAFHQTRKIRHTGWVA
jgi:hypothetical protein